MNPTFPKRTLLAGITVLALVLAGFLVWRHGRMQVGAEDVAAFLDRTVGGGRVRFSVARVEIRRQDEADLQMTVAATARTFQALYLQIDAAGYLRRTFQLDPESTAEARRLLADKGSSQNSESTGAGPLPADPYQAVILQLKSPADTPFDFQGVIDARRDGNGAWSFSLVSGGFEGGGPQGEERSAFGDSSFAAGDTRDDARLLALVTGLQSYAGRLAETRRNLESARAAALDGRRKAFLAQIVPGRVFGGQALEAGESDGTPLYLEITGLSPGNEVTALLRNDGSWHNARAFQGTWSADEGFEHPTLNLASTHEQAVRNAGPFLENTQSWTFALHMDPKGELSEQNPFFQYQFLPLSLEQVSALKVRLEMEFAQAITATEPGLLYHGAAFSRDSGASEPVLLRFTSRSEEGESLEARIESTTRSWRRPLHGTIIANARRSDGEPIRLQTRSNEAAEDAPAESVLGDQEDLDLHLGIEGGSLVGEDARFTYRLAAVGRADLHRMEADRAERARHFMDVLRDGIVYNGFLRDDQGSVSFARLEIGRVDRQTGKVAARIRSLARLDVYQDFLGTFDPSGGSIVLGATGHGVFDSVDDFGVPFLMAPGAMSLHLALTGNSIGGRIEGNPHWTMEFPADAFLSVPTESSEPNSPPADGSVFPSFPKKGGAYLLSRGRWLALPKNQGHIVVETVHPPSDEEMPTGIFDVVTKGVGELAKTKGKISYLQFDGKARRAESSGPAVILLYVGPGLSGDPLVELAPAEILKDGGRRVKIMGGSPEKIRFGEERLAAYARRVAPDCILLTTTFPLAPGPYVFNANGGYELTQK